MKHLIYFSIAALLVACNEDEPGTQAQEEVVETSKVIEITTPMTFADEDYQGERSSYFYKWNGSYSPENMHRAIKSDGTFVYTGANQKGEIYYLEEGSSDVIILDPNMPTNTDLAVIDDVVYMIGFSSVFESDRKLYVYQLEDEAFKVLDSASIDVGIANIRLFVSEGIDEEIIIHLNSPYAMDYVYRFKNGKLQPFMSYQNPVAKRVVFPFKGNYLEYTGSKLSRLDDQGNPTTIIDKYDLDLPRTLEWHYMYFSEDLIFIDLKELVNNERSYALVYDGKDLMKIEAPLLYSSGGYPIHTPFNDGNKYLHYDPATKLLDVYFRGSALILFKTYDRVYKYQMTLAY